MSKISLKIFLALGESPQELSLLLESTSEELEPEGSSDFSYHLSVPSNVLAWEVYS